MEPSSARLLLEFSFIISRARGLAWGRLMVSLDVGGFGAWSIAEPGQLSHQKFWKKAVSWKEVPAQVVER